MDFRLHLLRSLRFVWFSCSNAYGRFGLSQIIAERQRDADAYADQQVVCRYEGLDPAGFIEFNLHLAEQRVAFVAGLAGDVQAGPAIRLLRDVSVRVAGVGRDVDPCRDRRVSPSARLLSGPARIARVIYIRH